MTDDIQEEAVLEQVRLRERLIKTVKDDALLIEDRLGFIGFLDKNGDKLNYYELVTIIETLYNAVTQMIAEEDVRNVLRVFLNDLCEEGWATQDMCYIPEIGE